MSQVKCPGQDTRFWTVDDIAQVPCHSCGTMIEFWKDEGRRRCTKCGARVRNPKVESGCAKWCAHAEQCLGYVPTDADRVESVCDQLISEMKDVFGTDEKRIRHTLRVLEFAEGILDKEQASPLVVKAAAVLHDIGVPGVDGPAAARRIMQKVGLDDPTIDHICRIVANHRTGGIDTPEFNIVWDAKQLANVPAKFPELDEKKLKSTFDNVFRTAAGRKRAAELFRL